MTAAQAQAEAPTEPDDHGATAPSEEPPITHFNFQHKVFATPGARFALEPHSRKPSFYIDVGELKGVLQLDALRREFKITDDTHDGKLISLAVQGLRYVPDVRPGDTVPTEILTGEASWSVSDKHRLIAQQRLQVQLLSWVSGKEIVLTDAAEISNFLGQIENRDKLKSAFGEAAVAMGLAADNTDAVMAQLELLARELCYIEALRDRVTLVRMIPKKLVALGKTYGNDRMAKFELERVQQLVARGVRQLDEVLAEADAQSGEVIAALKSVERQVKFIRDKRDSLHALLRDWEPMIAQFRSVAPVRSPKTDKIVAALYRFLAPRFTSGQSLMARAR